MPHMGWPRSHLDFRARRRRLRVFSSLGFSFGFGIGLASPTPALGAETRLAGIQDYKRLSLSELMDLEVTSVSRRPEKFSDAASALQVITADDIRRSGATSLPEALRLANNLQVAQRGAQGWAISSRGFNTELSNKLLVLIDGRTVYSPLFSGVFWEAQDYLLADIERIEVISGPGGTLWGANAVNGVINITTKNAGQTQGLLAETGIGDELQGLAGLRYGGQLAPGVHYRLYGKFIEGDGGVRADGSDAPTDWGRRQGGFRIDAEGNARNSFTFQGDLYDNTQDRPGDEPSDLEGGNLLARWIHRFENDSELTVQAYHDRTRLSQFVPAGGFSPAGRFGDDLATYDLDLQHSFRTAERHRIVWGLGYRRIRDDVSSAPGLAFAPELLEQDLYSAFVQDEIELGPDWSLTLGTKVEHNDYTGWETEPGARLKWNLARDHLLWAAVSRAVRMPSRVDRDLRQPAASPTILAGDDGFGSEEVLAYELGYRAAIGPSFVGSLALFYNRYDDLRSVSVTPGTVIPFYFDNNLEGETHGLELDLTHELTPAWRLRAGYTLLVESIRVKPGAFDLNNALNETADPRNQFSLRSAWDLPRRLELDLGLRRVDELRINNNGSPAEVPAYWELDARLAWRPTEDWELSLVGRNLLHDHHPEYGVPGPAREEIERSVFAKVAWTY